jgi:hypothetical protein
VAETLRQLVTLRARGRCEYCQTPQDYGTERFSLEHIEPRVGGGLSEPDNLALACQGCNGYKSDKTLPRDPVSGLLTPLFHPRCHIWGEHFSWQEEGLQIVGLTPMGRATVKLLRLNRQPLINLRGALIAVGAHPQNFRPD